MKNEPSQPRPHWIPLTLQTLTLAGVLCGAWSVYTARKGITDQHEWNRRHYTASILKDFNRDVEPFKDAVLTAFPGMYDSQQIRNLTEAEANSLYRVDPSQDPNKYKTRTAVMKFLNYMEFICMAYQSNIVDQETVYTLYNGLFLRAYQYFRPFINIAQKEHGGQQFKPVVDVCEHWKKLKEMHRFEPMEPLGKF
jgi:hypothetical protein